MSEGIIYKNKSRKSGSQSEVPSLTIDDKHNRIVVNGYQKLVITKNNIVFKHYAGKFNCIKDVLEKLSEECKTLVDLGCSSGSVCYIARNAGFEKVTGLDHDTEYLGLINRVTSHFNFDNISTKEFSFGNVVENSDVVVVCALIHWVYSCTATFYSLDKIIEYLAGFTNKYMIIEWVDPKDGAIKFFNHTSYNKDAKKEPYNKAEFMKAINKYFSESKFLLSIGGTRELYLVKK
jgi:trans-aconitate methyltransferase